MKFSIAAAALVALSAATASAAPVSDAANATAAFTYSGTIYIYVNNRDHPKTTFVKKGDNNQVVTNGAGCKGSKLLPGSGDDLVGTFTTMDNQWGFNGQHENEINMGYIKVGDQCLSLTPGSSLGLDTCPSFDEEIKAGNKFGWFHDKRNSAVWAYSGDAEGDENNGTIVDAANLQTTGKTLTATGFHDDPIDNTFLGLGHVNLGHSGKPPIGCE